MPKITQKKERGIKMTIKGLSAIRRLPRLGKIRLGVKAKSASGKEYPKEVSYFVCPPEVERIYGEKPVELEIMFPLDDTTIIFPQNYKWYSAQSLNCRGNGETAMRRVSKLTEEQKLQIGEDLPTDQNDFVDIPCPCPLLESGECSHVGNLMVMLPKVSMSGIFQLDTGSRNNIINLNSSMEFIRGILGRVALVPLKLRRKPQVMEYLGKKATHYLLSLEFEGDLDAVKAFRQDTERVLLSTKNIALPAPIESGPEPTGPAPIESVPEPTAPATPPVKTLSHTGLIEKISVIPVEGTTPDYKITMKDGKIFFTGDLELAMTVKKLKAKGDPVQINYLGLKNPVILGIKEDSDGKEKTDVKGS